ncbi:hypothetical protein [Rickettsia tamurae]|nr:hypothetical protein [Rickettsia tamurae]
MLHGSVFPSLREGIVAWINFTCVTPWSSHGVTHWVFTGPHKNDILVMFK